MRRTTPDLCVPSAPCPVPGCDGRAVPFERCHGEDCGWTCYTCHTEWDLYGSPFSA